MVVSLCARNDAIYAKTLLKMNWQDFSMTGAIESHKYMKDVAEEMKQRVAKLKQDLNPIYTNLLLNKISSALPINFLLNIYKIKKTISVETPQQFLFDMQHNLKTLLLELPEVGEKGAAPSETYKTLVDKNLQRVMGRLKVMSYPAEVDVITEGYQQILDSQNDKNKSQEDLVAILTLRGLGKTTDLKSRLDKFEKWVNNFS